MRGDSNFRVGNWSFWNQEVLNGRCRIDQKLVSLDEVIKYFSCGISYNAFPPEFKNAFRKINFSVKDVQTDIFEKL